MPPQVAIEEQQGDYPRDECLLVPACTADGEEAQEQAASSSALLVSPPLLPPLPASDPWKNRNVILNLLWSVVAGVADSIWMNTILAGFLLALAQAMHADGNDKDDNTLVGTAEAIQGLAMLFSALPVGLIADWFGKARVVAYGGVLFIAAFCICLIALEKAKHAVSDDDSPDSVGARHAYNWMLVALALGGIGQGVVEGPAQALFADSIPQGQRSNFLTWQYTLYLLSSMTGPIVGVIMLARRGTDESWSLSEIYPVFVVGILLELPGVVIMFFFRDDCAIVEPEQQQISATGDTTTPQTAIGTRPTLESLQNNDLETPLLQEEGDGNIEMGESTTTRQSYHDMGKASIPYVLFLASLVTSLGSGASVKYFPLFFGELGFSSAFVQGIYIIVPVSIAIFSFAAQRISQRLGRIETSVLFEVIGVSLLYYMTYLSQDESEMSDFQKYEIIAVHILRTGLMNAGYPLLESILMDALPSNQRARWKSLESVASFGWTGSALIGGILADERSYRFTFVITASMQLVGTLMLLPLRPFVEPETSCQESNTPSSESEDQD